MLILKIKADTCKQVIAVLIGLGLVFCSAVQASDWNQFRGPNGSGISPDPDPLPVSFGESENLQWKVALPGAGVSCPIVIGDKVFVSCYSGYGLERQNPGDMKDLKRHLVCLDRTSGTTIWERTVEATLPEDEYSGAGVPEHGYASHTPVSDGKSVFAFFGKSGVYAWDLDGKELWHTAVGTMSDDHLWGSSSSPIVHENLLIVPAGPETRAVVGIDKNTGKELWKSESDRLGNVWGTPAISKVDDTRTDIVIGAPNEIWAINPATGKLKWYCTAMATDQFNSSVVVAEQTIYAVEGRGGGSIAVKAGGKGDVTASNIVWSGHHSNRFSTPLVYDGRIYLISGGIAKCVNAANGTEVFEARIRNDAGVRTDNEVGRSGLSESTTAGSASSADNPAQSPEGNRGGRGGRGGFGGGRGSDYSSPILGDGKIFYVTRAGDIHILNAGTSFEKLATNRLTSESEDFSATPAISNGQIFFRSNKHLYCVSKK